MPLQDRQLPKIKFRVLIVGRANAGKTSILQRVCDTTDSPVIYRRTGVHTERVQLHPSMERGEHTIEDELEFSNHDGFIFHDSCGFEAGSVEELAIVQKFIRRRSGERLLRDRLHAIWYCVPMDNRRPELDIRHFNDLCPDENVPVIAIFTKYDQFLRDVRMHLEDYGNTDDIPDVAARQFEEHYLSHLGKSVRRQIWRARANPLMEDMNRPETRCQALLDKTVDALNDDTVILMLMAAQKNNLELSINVAVRR
ncbi:GTP-binding protein [Lactarius vividus]|nr:GTP-binding protein [Lactarius vividus]